jgi:NADPH-dependent 2,4-dienoyl-CoA reductase/sulfur reductase-like enzyme
MSTVSTAGAETMVTAFDLRDAVPVRVIVLGAGVAGCAAALAFARGAHEVVVLDRGDVQLFDGWSADEVFQRWQRRGIAQFRPRCKREWPWQMGIAVSAWYESEAAL